VNYAVVIGSFQTSDNCSAVCNTYNGRSNCLNHTLTQNPAYIPAAAAGKGIANPLEINIMPSKKGLGSVSKKHQQRAAGTSNKIKSKKGRGGERSRRRKAIAARHAAKQAAGDRQMKMEAATGTEGVFAFINYNLGSGSEAADKLRDAGVYGGGSSSKQPTAGAAALAVASVAAGSSKAGGRQLKQQQPDRQGLVGSHDNLAEKKVRQQQKQLKFVVVLNGSEFYSVISQFLLTLDFITLRQCEHEQGRLSRCLCNNCHVR
jgi:hypothetical protein